MGNDVEKGRSDQERISVQGISAGLSLNALRAMLDPGTREAATIDLDLRNVQLEIPATILHEFIARFVPGASLSLRDDGLTFRPGGGSPGLRLTMPDEGMRAQVRQSGVRVGQE